MFAKSLKMNLVKPNYFVFVDGGALRNGKKDAIAGYSVHFENHSIFNTTKEVTDNPTNNRAELLSILCAFNLINTNYNQFINNKIVIVSDSMYSINCITSWSNKWLKNGFRTSSGNQVLNKDIIQDLLMIKDEINDKKVDIVFKHVKSHTVAPIDKNSIEYKIWFYNNLVDSNITTLLKKK